jgi:hypothetical protein
MDDGPCPTDFKMAGIPADATARIKAAGRNIFDGDNLDGHCKKTGSMKGKS